MSLFQALFYQLCRDTGDRVDGTAEHQKSWNTWLLLWTRDPQAPEFRLGNGSLGWLPLITTTGGGARYICRWCTLAWYWVSTKRSLIAPYRGRPCLRVQATTIFSPLCRECPGRKLSNQAAKDNTSKQSLSATSISAQSISETWKGAGDNLMHIDDDTLVQLRKQFSSSLCVAAVVLSRDGLQQLATAISVVIGPV